MLSNDPPPHDGTECEVEVAVAYHRLPGNPFGTWPPIPGNGSLLNPLSTSRVGRKPAQAHYIYFALGLHSVLAALRN